MGVFFFFKELATCLELCQEIFLFLQISRPYCIKTNYSNRSTKLWRSYLAKHRMLHDVCKIWGFSNETCAYEKELFVRYTWETCAEPTPPFSSPIPGDLITPLKFSAMAQTLRFRKNYLDYCCMMPLAIQNTASLGKTVEYLWCRTLVTYHSRTRMISVLVS